MRGQDYAAGAQGQDGPGKDGPDGDALFSAYLHPPMMLPDDGVGAGPSQAALYPHPPMFPADWNDGAGAGVAN
ncbi:hypothetical protein K488DRAFT_86488 [Vararia minispora EC-137]|uniref:Uncharacterized protein n=1 Tax=Vararia minispora EC-137 TaxID=1314806 RepID=A0ACB8QJC3_9AGAM|nr:hypothetical protein K488DRAFT_86488 [Vararia minispora EC-137]